MFPAMLDFRNFLGFRPGERMEDLLLKELLSFVESDAKMWEKAAQHCEDRANELDKQRGAEWHLLCAVYRERAKLHGDLVAKMKRRAVS
jgi:hypothetical protein